MSPARSSRVVFIFVTILLDAVGLGLLIPVLPDVLRRFVADPRTAADYYGWFLCVYATMQFLVSPVLGALSDRFGRRPILLISLFGAAIDYLFMAYAPTLSLLFVGRVISGLTGASMTVASSYMADISDADSRAKNFGMIGAAWGMGFIAGPLLGGALGAFGPAAPFLAAAALNALNLVFGLLVLPESLPRELRRKMTLKSLDPFRSLASVFRLSPTPAYFALYFVIVLAGQVHPVNWTLYTQLKFHWTAWQVGMSLAFVGVVIALAQGGLTRVIIPRLGERRSFTFGTLIYAVGFLLFGVVPEGWMVYPVLAFFSLSGVTMPALQSLVSSQVPASRQGELQGCLVSLASLAAIIAPVMFTSVFSRFTAADAPVYFPGAAYVCAAALCLGAFVCTRLVARAPVTPPAAT